MRTKLAALIAVLVFLGGCVRPIVDPPVIEWIIADNEMGIYVVSFKAEFVNDGPFSLVWDAGDGTVLPGENPTHDYGMAGEFLVTLTATNERGESSGASLLVYVKTNVVCYFENADTLACLYPKTREDWML